MAKLTDYTPLKHNPNKGSKRGNDLLETSLEQGGIGRSIVSGIISKVGRTRFNYTASYFGKPLEISNNAISSLSGAYIQRGNTVYPVED